MKSYAKFGYAAPFRFRVILEKPQGGQNDPPPGRRLTRALLGGVWTNAPPLLLRFFEASENTAARSAAGFSPTLPPILSTTLFVIFFFKNSVWNFVKILPNAMWGQVTRSGQVTQLQNTFPIGPRLQCFRESYESFGIWWGHQCLQNVYLGFFISVTSGQVIIATSPL